jgi:hypothetical protein
MRANTEVLSAARLAKQERVTLTYQRPIWTAAARFQAGHEWFVCGPCESPNPMHAVRAAMRQREHELQRLDQHEQSAQDPHTSAPSSEQREDEVRPERSTEAPSQGRENWQEHEQHVQGKEQIGLGAAKP